MPIDERVRTELTAAAEDVPTGPDLATSLRAGRRQRTRRTATVVTASAMAVGSIALAASMVPWAGSSKDTPSEPVVADAPDTTPDFVPGTDIDEQMQQTISGHIALLGAADDVYAGDWKHDGPLPAADFAKATDWQASYTLGAHEQVLVVMGFPAPGEATEQGCDTATAGGRGAPRCHQAAAGDGTVTSSGYTLLQPASEGLDQYTYITSYQSADGFTVNALERVQAGSWQAANEMRMLDDAALTELVIDPALTFPEPQRWPN